MVVLAAVLIVAVIVAERCMQAHDDAEKSPDELQLDEGLGGNHVGAGATSNTTGGSDDYDGRSIP